MSTPGIAVDVLTQPVPGWAQVALRVSRGVRDLTRASMDAVESAVNVPLSASQPGATRTGPSSASGDFDSSNDPAPEKIPLPCGGETSDIDGEHAAMWSLVRAAQHGDGEAFGKLYDEYVDSVFRFVYYRVNDRALAEDFTSETFLRALRRISSINYQGRDIGAWFITIARNIVFDHAKSARFRLELTTGEVIEGDDVDAGPEFAVLTNLTNSRLLQAVNSLGEEQKECIVLRFLNGLSVAETASVMGKNDGAIKALQHRAVKRLASVLGDELK
ncbi:MAG TPA: sigma-70 family RNA polymerase sigma factor [Jatrophihabitans sp.]|jgi:RNA polymerase sigma-70 factor (ECF subfamily)